MEKNRRYALILPLALFILAILFLTGLYRTISGWLIIVVMIIIPAIIVYFLPKEPEELEEEDGEEGETRPVGRVSRVWSNIQGVLVIIAFLFVPVIIILIAWWPMIGPADSTVGINILSKTYGPKEFQTEGVCSKTGCQIDSTGVVLSNGGYINLKNTENISIHQIVVTPEALPIGSVVQSWIGLYKFQVTAQEKTYRGDIFLYSGIKTEGISEQTCTDVESCLPLRGEREGVPIIIGVNRWNIIPFGWLPTLLSHQQPFIRMKYNWYDEVAGGSNLVYGDDKGQPVQGQVVVSSVPGGGTITIKEVKIY